MELRYLQNLQKLGTHGFSYFINPGGYIGKSVAFELGIALSTNVPCYFSHKPKDLPVYVPSSHIISTAALIDKINIEKSLPQLNTRTRNSTLYKMMKKLVNPGSIVAAGGIIEYQYSSNSLPEILLVKTHKWGHRYSIVGGKVQRGERLHEALLHEIKEKTGMNTEINEHITTFDQIKNSGYYHDFVHHMFVDYVTKVESKKVRLNDDAQDYIWLPAEKALAELDIEPNAKHTLELYTHQLC